MRLSHDDQEELFEALAHGDQAHRDWLKEAIRNWSLGIPPPAYVAKAPEPVPMRLRCPECGHLHIDKGAFATKPHHTHACQNCGEVWRPAVVATVGVRFLPNFKDKVRKNKT